MVFSVLIYIFPAEEAHLKTLMTERLDVTVKWEKFRKPKMTLDKVSKHQRLLE